MFFHGSILEIASEEEEYEEGRGQEELGCLFGAQPCVEAFDGEGGKDGKEWEDGEAVTSGDKNGDHEQSLQGSGDQEQGDFTGVRVEGEQEAKEAKRDPQAAGKSEPLFPQEEGQKARVLAVCVQHASARDLFALKEACKFVPVVVQPEAGMSADVAEGLLHEVRVVAGGCFDALPEGFGEQLRKEREVLFVVDGVDFFKIWVVADVEVDATSKSKGAVLTSDESFECG